MAHRSRLAGFIIDCQADDPAPGAAFWAEALGSETRLADGSYVTLDAQSGLYAAVQAVEHLSRVHLDIESDDIPAEVARLEKLGARKVAEVKTWVVMEAPTGHRFCVVRAGTDFPADAKESD
ncbi:MAG: VOC family protein [Rhodobacteraceae bacterium]|nr:VOC family protein [Paracoccaceae bacterium]